MDWQGAAGQYASPVPGWMYDWQNNLDPTQSTFDWGWRGDPTNIGFGGGLSGMEEWDFGGGAGYSQQPVETHFGYG